MRKAGTANKEAAPAQLIEMNKDIRPTPDPFSPPSEADGPAPELVCGTAEWHDFIDEHGFDPTDRSDERLSQEEHDQIGRKLVIAGVGWRARGFKSKGHMISAAITHARSIIAARAPRSRLRGSRRRSIFSHARDTCCTGPRLLRPIAR